MSLSATFSLGDEHYLPPEERERRAKEKERQLVERGLTPDWFKRQRNFCLPAGGLSVAVIGGGFSGLGAGWYLSSCGASPVVYEARNSIGGRVRTDRALIPGKVLEEGAELIGENHPLWRTMARRFGLELEPISEEGDYPGLAVRTRFGGRDLSKAEKESLDRELLRVWAAIGAEAEPIPETEPWRHRGAAGYDAKSVKRRLDELIGTAPGDLRTWFEFTLGNDNCAPINRQSYLGLLASVSAARMGSDAPGMLGYWLSTETHRCKGGNDLLGEKLGQFLGSAIRIETVVDGIGINPLPWFPRVLVASSRRDPSGTVLSRRVDAFHYAVLTAPPSVWERIKVMPPMDPAGRTVQHGAAVKFLSQYRAEFWREAGLAPLAKWTELGSVWEGTDKQSKEIPGFDLTVFSGGPFVLPAAKYPTQLTALYPTRGASLTGEQLVNWPAERFIETGYAVPGVGQASTVMPALMEPHADRLYFAGEQASPGFFGYMEGALQSGARAARDIILDAIVPCPGAPQPSVMPWGGGGGESGGGGSGDSY